MRFARRARGVLLGIWLPCVCGCGGDPPGPGPSQPPAPVITCPSTHTVVTLRTDAVTVDYPAPQTRDGQPPLSVSCTPGSGTSFPIGVTPVTCAVTDTLGRRASCAFDVRVSVAPATSKTRFLAFGDSLTSGTTSPDPVTLVVNVPDSYPVKLQMRLSERYPAQSIDVLNDGCGGEFVDEPSLHCPGGVSRLPGALREHSPQVLLLMHGANNLLNFEDAGIPRTVAGIEEMVRIAERAGVPVILAGLPPQNPAGSRGQGADEVPTLNAELEKVARRRNAIYLNLFTVFGGSTADLIGVDGLHPTVRGYERIAEAWFEAIRQAYETDPGQPLLIVAPQRR